MIDLRKTFKIISFSVVAAGFLTLISTGSLSVPVIGMTVLSMVIGWFYGERLVQIPRADTVATTAILLIFALSVVGFLFFDRPFVTTTTTFLISVQAVRILFLTETRHYLQSYLIALFSVLAATVLTFSPIFILFFILYLVLATAGMIVLTMVADVGRIKGPAASIELKRSHLVGLTGGSVVFTVVATAVIFVFFPRLSAGFLPSSIAQPVRVPGFSNNVELGEVGDLKISSEIIMRVVIDSADAERLGPNVYWRGTAFDSFDGKYWEKSNTKSPSVKKIGGRFIVTSGSFAKPILQDYFLEPTDSRVLFCLGHPTTVTGSFTNLFIDRYGTIQMGAAVGDKVRYTVESVLTMGRGASPSGDIGPLSLEERNAYLRNPEDLDPRIRPLVLGIVGEEKSPTRKAELIRKWLLQNMSYDLNLKVIGKDPLAEFLFDQRRGYCEHFATAMAVMLRIVGVPSRVATGFLSGQYNEMGSFFTVRASDAHAWVEAYIDDAGWTLYEPTPPAGLAVTAPRSAAREFIESLVMKWHVYVVNYEMGDQLKIVEGVRGTGRKGRDLFSDARFDLKRYLGGLKAQGREVSILATVAAAAALFLLAWYVVRAVASGTIRRKRKADRIVRIYLRAVRFFAGKGIGKGTAMTPREFSRRVAERFPKVSDDIDSLAEIYYLGRFGPGQRRAGSEERARQHLEKIRESFR